MPKHTVRQPNGLYARFSTVVDNFTAYDLTPQEVEAEMVEEVTEQAKRWAADSIKVADAHPERLEDDLSTVQSVHGIKEANELRLLLIGKEKP